MYKKTKQLTDVEAAMLIDCIKKPDKLQRAKDIVEATEKEVFHGVGDVCLRIDNACLYAVYEYKSENNKTMYYVPVTVINEQLAVCVSVY